MRLSMLLVLIVLTGLGCGVFSTATKVQTIQKSTATIDRKTQDERDSIRVLEAEWSYLNSPERLEKLARENFDLVPIDGRQYVALAALPVRSTLDAQENSEKEKALANVVPGARQLQQPMLVPTTVSAQVTQ